MSKVAKIVVGVIVLFPVLYVGSCGVTTHLNEKAFAHIQEGNTEQQVIAAMGEPADRETMSNRLAKYGAPECRAPCVQRLWYSNKLSLAGEAWFVELNAGGHVVHTAHLVSP